MKSNKYTMDQDGVNKSRDGQSQPVESLNRGSKAPADNQSNRFIPQGLQSQHPGIGVRLDLDAGIERDAYGQPLSPNHLIAVSKPFAGPKAGGSGGDGKQAHSASMQQTHSNLAAQGSLNQHGVAEEGTVAGPQPAEGSQERAGGAALAAVGNGIAPGLPAQQAHGPVENSQSALLGPPKHAGLTTFEYAVDSQLRFYCAEMKPEHVDAASVERYERIFHGESGFTHANGNSSGQLDGSRMDDWKTSTAGGSSINRKNIQIETDKQVFSLAQNETLNRSQKVTINPQFQMSKGRPAAETNQAAGDEPLNGKVAAPHQQEDTLEQLLNAHFKTQAEAQAPRYLMELQINLPTQTLVDQVEVKLGQAAERYELFRKYLRIAGLTRSSVLRKDALERDSQITQDIQMTYLSNEARRGDEEAERLRLRAQKFFKIQSGYLDAPKTTAEFNLGGAVCNQLNLLFEFDFAKVQELIAKCKKIQADRIGQNVADLENARGGASQGAGKEQQLGNTAGHNNGEQQDAPESSTGLREQLKISQTNSQFMSSSYGDEMYYNIGEGSEMDDLDNEVQIISKRQQNVRQGANLKRDGDAGEFGGSAEDAEGAHHSAPGAQNKDQVAPDEIRIIIDDDDGADREGGNRAEPAPRHSMPNPADAGLHQSISGTGLQKQLQEKSEAQKLTKTAKAANSHGFFNYSDDEKKLLDERKIFEGTSHATWAQKLLTLVLQAVKITGFNMSKIPAITTLSHLMNTSFYLKKDKVHLEDALEVDFMLGTLMISSKRNTQAIELLRNKVQAPYLHQIEHNIAKVQGKSGLAAQGAAGQNEQSSSLAGALNEFQGSILSNDSKQNLKVQIKKLFTRCAMIELMCSESMCMKPQLSDKLQALSRMTQLCRGQLAPPLSFGKQIFLADDEYTTMTRILPYMLKFTIQCIENNYHCSREIVIISALRNVQFVLETQGCSLDSAMIVILKSIFKNYPDKAKQEKILKRQREIRAKLQQNSSLNDQGLINIQGAGSANLNGGALGLSSHTKTLLSESKRIGGIQGTSSANELNLRGSQQRTGLNSTKEMQQLVGYQFNQNSARGSQNTTDHLRLDESRHLQNELNKIFRLDKMTMIESIFSLSWIPVRDEPVMKKEPNSGFEKTLMNLFNTLLESYISVLSSISSHILHQIFYEVIVPCLTGEPFEEDRLRHDSMDKEERQILGEFTLEVKIFAVKIAEKIITICQGDLIMSRPLLDTLVKATSAQSYKKQLEMTGAGEQYRSQMKNLWASIRSKVFTNYSMKGFKQLIEWLVSKMSMLAQNCNILDGKSSASEIAMLELSDDNLQQLSQYLEIITFISVGRRNSQEEANSLIKIKHEYCMDLYLLLNPLLFWLDFSVEREERLNLFKHVYQTIKDVLENLPPKKVDIDILQIIVPILERTSEYLRQSSPTQSMLKFLDIVLQDIIDGKYCEGGYPTNLQYFFLDQLTSIVGYISYSLYEEIFPVFDKLLQLCGDVVTEDTLRRCIVALVDKYTMKCKGHKHTVSQFMKSLLDSNTAPAPSVAGASRQGGRRAGHPGQDGANFGGEFMDIFDQEIDIVENPDRHAQGKRNPASQRETAARNQGAGRRAKKNSFYDVMLEQCFFDNDDSLAKVAANVLSKDRSKGQQADDTRIRRDDTAQFRSPQDLHEVFVEKLQFFIDSLSLLGEHHISQFNALISNKKFKTTLFNLLNAGETNLRLKCHEILEIVGTYFIQVCSSKSIYQVALPPGAERTSGANRGRLPERQSQSGVETELMEVDLISHDRLYIAQLIIQCVRKSFERNNGDDSYLQFNSLILLDYLFQNILPVANFQNEQIKQRQNTENQRLHNQQVNNAVAGQGRGQGPNMGGMAQNLDRHGADAGSDGNEQLEDSHLEDGSSGGEGTGGQNSRQARMRNENAQARQRLIEERIPNANYLGELEDALDVETLNITSNTPELEVTDPRYTAMRIKLVFKLWPYVQEALNSPWSNIRSICYGLICSMLKIDIRDCQKFLPHQHLAQVRMSEERKGLSGEDALKFTDEERNQILMTDLLDKQQMESNKFYLKLRQSVIPMMINLLSSKESESKAGGLNILGSICGLSYDFSKIKITRNLEFFKRNSEFISLPIWQHVFELQDDWDITIKEASIVLIQLCAPREAIKYFNKCKIEKETQKFQLMLNKMARSGGAQGGHGSLSNLSSARQNSLYNHINSKGSLNGLRRPQNETGTGCGVAAGDSSNRRIDYKNVDFGYKDKHIPHIPGLINEFGKIDIATFLNDNQDMMHLNVEEENTFEPTGLGSGGLGSNATGSSQPGQKSLGAGLQKGHSGSGQIRENTESNRQLSGDPDHILGGNKQLALDLGKIYETKDDQQKRTNALDAEAAFQQSSMSQTSNYFGQNYQQHQLNQQILQQSLQQNQNLVQAMQGQNPGASQSSLLLHQQFDFFVDEYSDDQIQEIISIFRNDFKPPKSLWIEKAAESTIFSGPDFYQDIYSSAIEQFNQQQMMLQQKQQQDLQEQVSNGSSLSGAAAQDGSKLSAGDNIILDVGPSVPSQAAQAARRGEFSPPPQKESTGQDDGAAPGSSGAQDAAQVQQQIMQNLDVDGQSSGTNPQARDPGSSTDPADRKQDEQAQAPGGQPTEQEPGQSKKSAPPPSSSSSNANSMPSSPELSPAAAASGQNAAGQRGQAGSEQFQRFDPSRDLNIFEQINFDEMNINQEDINSCNFKQDVINSSTSDIGENSEADQANVHQQLMERKAEGRGRSPEASQNDAGGWAAPEGGGAGVAEGKTADVEMDSEAQLDIDDGHIEILSSQHDLQAPQAADGGKTHSGQEEPGAQGDIEAAHELDLRMIDMHHGVNVELFHQTSHSNSQKYASGSKVSQSQDDTPAQHGYMESDSNATAEKGGLHDASNSSSPGASPVREQPERYHKMGQLATDLPVIESRSNEVSSSAVSVSAADRDASHRSLQGMQQMTSTQKAAQLPRGASGGEEAAGRGDSADHRAIGNNAGNAAKSSQPNMVHVSEPSEEADMAGTGQLPLGAGESGERPYVDIQESGFDENAADHDSELRDSPDAGEEDEQEQLLAHFEQQNSMTLQMIQQDQKRGVSGQPPAATQQSASDSLHANWAFYGGASQVPGSQSESHRSKKGAPKGRQGHHQGAAAKTSQGPGSKVLNAGAPGLTINGPTAGSGQGLEDYEGPANLHFEDAGLIHFKQKMQARTQPIDVAEFRGLEQDVMMLANEYNPDQDPPYNNDHQSSAPQKPGMMTTKGASTTQKAGQGVQDHQANYKLLKPASNSNSSPDIKSQLYKIAAAKQTQQRKSKEKLKSKKQNITTKYQSEIDSARQNFVQAHIPIAAPAPMSLGNFSHRVQPSAGGPGLSSQYAGVSGPKQAGVGAQNQQSSAPGAKKQILKNLRHIKTNNEDYIIMQNISSQMNGKLTDSLYNPLQVNAMNLTTSGLNTTKNNKIDKSFENLMSAFALRGGQAKSGQGTSLGCIKTNAHASGKQHSHDSSQGLVPMKNQSGKSKRSRPAGLAQAGNADPINRNMSAASGKQKTLSTSPKRQSNNYEIKKLLSNATGGTMGSLQLGAVAKPGTKQSKLGQSLKGAGGQAKPSKSAKSGGAAGAGLSGTGQSLSTSSQNQQINNKRQQEQLKDLNYFIKTIEKFSKKNAAAAEKGPQYASLLKGQELEQTHLGRPSQPQVITGMDSGSYGGKSGAGLSGPAAGAGKAMRSRGSNGSDPQTPKDVLINLGDQMQSIKQGRSQSNQNSGMSNGRKASSKNKMNSLLGQALGGTQSVNLKNQGPGQKSKSSTFGALDPQQTQQLYEQMKHQQQLQASKALAKNLQHALRKNGLNLSQLNMILSQASQGQGPLCADFAGAPSAAAPAQQYTSIRNKNNLLNQFNNNVGSSGSRSRGRSGHRGGLELTPDSNANGGNRHGFKNNGVSKSSKSNKSQQQTGSYSPPHSGNQLFENLALSKHLLGKNLNINTNMQAQINNLVSSHREAGSVDSKGRSCSTNKSGRGSNNLKAKNHKKKKLSCNLNQAPPQLNNLMSVNYSQTQKLDMREINRQLMQISNPRGAGSTQNKAQKYDGILLSNNRGYGQHLNSQRERRDRSAGSNNSKSRAVPGSFKHAGQMARQADAKHATNSAQITTTYHSKFAAKNQQTETGAKYQNLLLSKKF